MRMAQALITSVNLEDPLTLPRDLNVIDTSLGSMIAVCVPNEEDEQTGEPIFFKCWVGSKEKGGGPFMN